MSHLEFVQAALYYLALHGGSVTSWYRTEKHNRAVGGAATSAHRQGLAVDVVYDAPVALAERQATAKRLKLRVIVESDHDHIQPVNWSPTDPPPA